MGMIHICLAENSFCVFFVLILKSALYPPWSNPLERKRYFLCYPVRLTFSCQLHFHPALFLWRSVARHLCQALLSVIRSPNNPPRPSTPLNNQKLPYFRRDKPYHPALISSTVARNLLRAFRNIVLQGKIKRRIRSNCFSFLVYH